MALPVPTFLGQVFNDPISGRSWICISVNPPMWGVNKNAMIAFAGGAAFGDRVTVTGGLNVFGGLNLAGGASITGTMLLANGISAGGGATFAGVVNLLNDVVINENATRTLSVKGPANFANNVSIGGNLAVTGSFTVNGVSVAGGSAGLGSNIFTGLQTMNAGITTNHLYVSNGATFAGAVRIRDITGGLSVTGGATITGGVALFGSVTVNGSPISTGAASNLPLATTGGQSGVASFVNTDFGASPTGSISLAPNVARTNANQTFSGVQVFSNGISVTGGITTSGLVTASGGLTTNHLYVSNGATFAGTISGTLNTASQPNITAIGTLTRLDVGSGGISSAGGITGTINTAAQPNVTSLGTLTSLSSSGLVTASGGLTTNHLYVSNGATFASGLVVSSGTISGTLATASQPNITAVGTLTRLDVGSGGISSAGGITGTLNTASQPNITAVGTLTRLDVGSGGISSSGGITGTLLTASQPNVTAVGVLTALNVTGALAVTGTSRFVGNSTFANGINVTNGITGTLLTASQPNITVVGTLTRLDVGSGGISSAGGITGTLLTASQPNITLVGTLTSLSSSGLVAASGGLTANHLYVSNGATFARGISVTGGTAYFNNDISVSGNHPGLPSYIYESNSGITFPGSSVTAFTIGDKWTNGSDEYTWIGNAWIQVDNVVSSGTNPANDMSNVAYRNVAQTFTAKQDFAQGISATYANIDSGLTVGFNARTTLLGDVEINQDSSRNLQINASTVNIKNDLVIGSSSSTLSSPSTPVYFGTGVPSLELRGNGNAGSGTLGYCGALQFVSSPASSPTIPVGGSGAAYIWAENGILRFGTGATAGGWRTRCRMTDNYFTVDGGNLKVGMLPTQSSTTTFEGLELNQAGFITLNRRSETHSSVDMIQFYRGATAGVNSNKIGQIQAGTNVVSYQTTSDYRLKQDIQPMIGGLEKVKQLKPCTYVWKRTGMSGHGFIAHEVQEIVDDVASGTKDEVDENGNPVYQGIDQSKLVATLTNAIQELNALVEAQQVEINNLKNRLM